MTQRFPVAYVTALALLGHTTSQAFEIAIPPTPGLEITVEHTAEIPTATNTIGFGFRDGRVVVCGDEHGIWSLDAGRSWAAGPSWPSSKTMLELDGGDVLIFGSKTYPRADGLFEMSLERRPGDGRESKTETAVLDIPAASTVGGDDGDTSPGFIVHHGALPLRNGDLLLSLYGNFQGDHELAEGYPVELNIRKVRTIVVSSSDGGKTWKNPVTVAYDRMLARGLDPDSQARSYKVVPAITQEGFNEADLARAPNGDLVCMMRTGGRLSVPSAPVFPTPMYSSRSRDEGQTWSPPIQVADRGSCPYLVTLENGIMVCAYARPGNWLTFSDDNGATWKGTLQFNTSDSYCNAVAVGPDAVLAVFHADNKVFGAVIRVAGKQ